MHKKLRDPSLNTGVAIRQTLESMLVNWKISYSKVHMVVADNASNMKKALREDNFEAQDRLLCAHITVSC